MAPVDTKKMAPAGAAEDQRREAARLLGRVRSEKKANAARENGKRGGRPRDYVVSEETRRRISEAAKRRWERQKDAG
jgi:hypothetical protein